MPALTQLLPVCVCIQIFFAFFLVAFFWFPIPNYFVPALFTMSMVCWGPHAWNPVLPFGRGGTKDLASVLGSGEAGAGMPGLGGWVSVWSYGPSVIPFQTTVWIVVGIVLIYWIFVPVAFFSGLAAWPGSFREFNSNGSFYNQSEGCVFSAVEMSGICCPTFLLMCSELTVLTVLFCWQVLQSDRRACFFVRRWHEYVRRRLVGNCWHVDGISSRSRGLLPGARVPLVWPQLLLDAPCSHRFDYHPGQWAQKFVGTTWQLQIYAATPDFLLSLRARPRLYPRRDPPPLPLTTCEPSKRGRFSQRHPLTIDSTFLPWLCLQWLPFWLWSSCSQRTLLCSTIGKVFH